MPKPQATEAQVEALYALVAEYDEAGMDHDRFVGFVLYALGFQSAFGPQDDNDKETA